MKKVRRHMEHILETYHFITIANERRTTDIIL